MSLAEKIAIYLLLIVLAAGSKLTSRHFLATAKIKINEIQANPESGKEWVELYALKTDDNQASTSAQISLAQWSLWDMFASSTKLFTFSSQTITAGELLVVPVTGLNNTKDGVILKNNSSQEVDRFTFEQTNKNTTWSRVPDGVGKFQQAKPSKNKLNQIINPDLKLLEGGKTAASSIYEKDSKFTSHKTTTDSWYADNNLPVDGSGQSRIGKNNKDQTNSRSSSHLDSTIQEQLAEYNKLATALRNKLASQKLQLATGSGSTKSASGIYFQHRSTSKPAVLSVIIGGTIWIAVAYYWYAKTPS